MLRDEYALLFSLFLEHASLVSEGIVQKAAVGRLLAEHRAGRADHGNRLWLLLNAELWYRIFIGKVEHEELSAMIADARRAPAGAH